MESTHAGCARRCPVAGHEAADPCSFRGENQILLVRDDEGVHRADDSIDSREGGSEFLDAVGKVTQADIDTRLTKLRDLGLRCGGRAYKSCETL